MYWPKVEYDPFEAEVKGHLEKNDGWFEEYCERELRQAEELYQKGFELEARDWTQATAEEMKSTLDSVLTKYREITCAWYCQYPLDEYFEEAIENHLAKVIPRDDPDFRKIVLIFTDPKEMTDVSEERWKLTQLAKEFFANGEELDALSDDARAKIETHLQKFRYINRGLATSKPYTYEDMMNRLKEIKHKIDAGTSIDDQIYDASQQKVEDEYAWALEKVKPNEEFIHVIEQARLHSYVRNRRVEAWFHADYGESFMYEEIAKRVNFNPDWIMEVSAPEMYAAVQGKPLPDDAEMKKRFENYAMVVRNAETRLITDPEEIKKLEAEYSVDVEHTDRIEGRMACLGGMIRGRAKVCLDKAAIGKVERGDILIAQFTTPDFVPAMEKAAAIVADQGGLSSHAAIVSRELGVPCVIGTKNGTRVIHDNDLLEIDAQKGIIKILERAS